MYEADLVLTCEGLETGQARDVHGQVRAHSLTSSAWTFRCQQVTITVRNAASRALPKIEKLHFRAADQTVSFFPPGSRLP